MGTGTGPYVVGKNQRLAGGFILQIEDNQFHIDPGPGSLQAASLCGVNIRANTAILLSHNHLYHCHDINLVIDAMTYSGFDKKGVLIGNRTSINGAELYQPYLIKHYQDFLEKFIVMDAGQRVGINDIEVQALKARHTDPYALGFKFFTSEFTLTYTGDTAYDNALVEQYKNSHILILNVPYQNKKDAKSNLCTEDAVKIIREVGPKLAIITHFGHEMIKADPLYEVREIQKQANMSCIAAKDGMVINPLSYSVDYGQRTLYTYSQKEGIRISEVRSAEQASSLGISKQQAVLPAYEEAVESIPQSDKPSKDPEDIKPEPGSEQR